MLLAILRRFLAYVDQAAALNAIELEPLYVSLEEI